MSATAFAALVDWGTSNLRVWLVDGEGHVLGERQSGDGMSQCAEGNRFQAVLEGHLASLEAPDSLPAIICGMAGARAGWKEAPYGEIPTRLDELYKQAVQPEASRPVFILPGLCQRQTGAYDVMRGEETQLAGLVAGGLQTGIICMPGTHSKWVDLDHGAVQRFTTVMTGELFEVISKHSILRLTIGTGEPDPALFAAAVAKALEPGFALTTSLFSLRASALLSTPAENEALSQLSGLLVGAEIAGMRPYFASGKTVSIVGSERLGRAYHQALTLAGVQSEICDGSALVRTGLFAAAQKLLKRNG